MTAAKKHLLRPSLFTYQAKVTILASTHNTLQKLHKKPLKRVMKQNPSNHPRAGNSRSQQRPAWNRSEDSSSRNFWEMTSGCGKA